MFATEVCTAAVPFNQFFGAGCSGLRSVRWRPCVKLLLPSLSFLRDVQLTLKVLVWCYLATTQISPWLLTSAFWLNGWEGGSVISTRLGGGGEFGSRLLMLPSCFFCDGLSCLHAGRLSEPDIFTKPNHTVPLWLIKMTPGGGGLLIKIASMVIEADRGEHKLFLRCCCNGRQESVARFNV